MVSSPACTVTPDAPLTPACVIVAWVVLSSTTALAWPATAVAPAAAPLMARVHKVLFDCACTCSAPPDRLRLVVVAPLASPSQACVVLLPSTIRKVPAAPTAPAASEPLSRFIDERPSASMDIDPADRVAPWAQAWVVASNTSIIAVPAAPASAADSPAPSPRLSCEARASMLSAPSGCTLPPST